MASHHSSMTSLSGEIGGIYQNSRSTHSLDSLENESVAMLHPEKHLCPPSNHQHGHDSSVPQSGFDTLQSSSSFDLTVHDSHNQVTDSSLNVLLGSTDNSKDIFVSLESMADSARSVDPLAIRNGQALATEESLSSYRNYDENFNGGDWAERGAAVATTTTAKGTTVIRRTVDDFEFGKDLGEGSYSTVVLAKDKVSGVQYAVKILDKRHIIKEKKVKYVNIEKHALNRLSDTQGVISLFFTFQDRGSLYFVLGYASNGELLRLIKKYGTLNEDCTRYLSAQILDAIKHMHIKGVIHRDIKPENILLDEKCRIRITDFGTAKLLERRKSGSTGAEEDYPLDVRAKSFVGTAEYVSPELLESRYCGKPGDLWAFGCILYQMIAGKPPFKATNEYLTFQKITKLQYAFSAGFPSVLRDLIKKILVLQPSRRATIDQIQSHHFFHKCDFSDPDLIWNREIPELSPYKMNAQSMMKAPSPQLAKMNVIKKIITKPQVSNGTQKRGSAETNGAAQFSPASVAAYVLSKDKDSSDATANAKTKTPPKPSVTRKANGSSVYSAPDYIPGANILRPQINKMSSYSIASTASSKSGTGLLQRNVSRVMEVTPPTAVEVAWEQYLSPSERVINVGQAIIRKLPTDVFEKKNRGYIHDAFLGYNNKLQSITNRGTSRSMLSHVVQGNRMRYAQELPANSISYSEEDAITFYSDAVAADPENIAEEEEEEGKLISVAANSARRGRSLLKKLLPSTEKKQDAANTSSPSANSHTAERHQSQTMDKVRRYTVVVTTFGRVLLFMRDDHKTDYKLVCEIGLNVPFIQFKEVVSTSSSKFGGRMIPSTGIFAIVVSKSTFMFETEKYEVKQWIDALARSKLNQHEREKEAEKKQAQRASPASSPRLLDLPAFASTAQRQSTRQASPETSHRPQHRASESPVSEAARGARMCKNDSNGEQKVKAHRKAPPSFPSSPSTGPGALVPEPEQRESETVHAAQLAVLNSPARSSTDNRRSSFSRDKIMRNSAYVSSLTTNGGAKITSMNSKLLARSRGKK